MAVTPTAQVCFGEYAMLMADSKDRTTMKKKILFGAVLICLAACGHSPNCTVTLSGAQTGTYDCDPATLGWVSPPNNEFNFGFHVGLWSFPRVSVGLKFPGEPQAITYTGATAGANGGVSVEVSAKSWYAPTINGVGSITLRFTNISVGPGGKGDYIFAGTLDAMLPSQTGTGTTVSLHAMFRGPAPPNCSNVRCY